jgi:hypothetical protein
MKACVLLGACLCVRCPLGLRLSRPLRLDRPTTRRAHARPRASRAHTRRAGQSRARTSRDRRSHRITLVGSADVSHVPSELGGDQVAVVSYERGDKERCDHDRDRAAAHTGAGGNNAIRVSIQSASAVGDGDDSKDASESKQNDGRDREQPPGKRTPGKAVRPLCQNGISLCMGSHKVLAGSSRRELFRPVGIDLAPHDSSSSESTRPQRSFQAS